MGGYAQSTEPERIRKDFTMGTTIQSDPEGLQQKQRHYPKAHGRGWPRHVSGKRNHLLCLEQKHGSYPESMGGWELPYNLYDHALLKLNPGIIYWWFLENREDTWHLHQLGANWVGRNWITEQKLKPWGVCEERGWLVSISVILSITTNYYTFRNYIQVQVKQKSGRWRTSA